MLRNERGCGRGLAAGGGVCRAWHPWSAPQETAPGHRSCSHRPGTALVHRPLRSGPLAAEGGGQLPLPVAGDVTAMSQPAGRGSGPCLVPGQPGAFSGSDPERPNTVCASLAPVSSLLPLRFAATTVSKQTERRFPSRQQ